MQEVVIHGPEALPEAAEMLLKYAPQARVMAFYGEIGAGKTSLIQALCRCLGVKEEVASPTFSIVNEYEYKGLREEKEKPVFHMDLYRLRDIEEALQIGIEDYLYSGAYCLIEWPELIEALLPEGTVRIKLEIIGDSSRKILIL
ncbi:MAG: tRNA (adenosine(37)-N6)-threonylcarbamoyltransferase complex ATPase subunit type 1 TsaE [Phaeodactylibacter sp.]|nr:tRNA (adenosine(37)-N6)-threonylcarbamoyltransferase complex ATPase subunit type 1 TsaE [Phaeodactylibacter sp.]